MITPPNRHEAIVDENGKPTRRVSKFFEAVAGGEITLTTAQITQIIEQQETTPAETTYNWY